MNEILIIQNTRIGTITLKLNSVEIWQSFIGKEPSAYVQGFLLAAAKLLTYYSVRYVYENE